MDGVELTGGDQGPQEKEQDQFSQEIGSRPDLKSEGINLQHHMNLSANRERCEKENLHIRKQESVRENQIQNLESDRESVSRRKQAIGWMEELEKNCRMQALNVQISCSCDRERSILGSCC